MNGGEIFFADQNLASGDPEKLSRNEVITKFKHFVKVRISGSASSRNMGSNP